MQTIVYVYILLISCRVVELHLSRNPELFHPMAVAVVIDEHSNSIRHPINPHQFYTGQISNDKTSHVKLHVTSTGILTASISTANDVIYIEVIYLPYFIIMCICKYVIQPASRFLKDSSENMFAYNRSKIIPREMKDGQR